ncbi:MAG: HD domain-containing protein [Planctomycetes bacterium]|nr:HD domain-containing protein [Planctomycetota bacterium]
MNAIATAATRESELSEAARSYVRAARRLAESCGYERPHTQQVTRLALDLFDQLVPLHGLDALHRVWLHAAALLHDIGRCRVLGRGHHKESMRIIFQSPLLPFDARERWIIGSVARYHTKAPPSPKHLHFAGLTPSERESVRRLSAILRLADALDFGHRGIVSAAWCHLKGERLLVRCSLRLPWGAGRRAALKRRALRKGRLLEEVFARRLVVKLLSARRLAAASA